jgi:hypothetical protein
MVVPSSGMAVRREGLRAGMGWVGGVVSELVGMWV